MTRYELAYRLIPMLISEFNKGNLKQMALLDENYIRGIIEKQKSDFDDRELIIEHKILSNMKSVAVYIFPEPQKHPEALFGLLFFDFTLKKTQYYTLEKSVAGRDGSDRWMLGLTPEFGTHENLGDYEGELNIEAVVNHIYNKYENQKKRGFWSWLS
jgi:hypothetical protein